jgi:hypothetical protein
VVRFYQPDLGSEPDSPFARDGNNKLVRRGYWLDMNDRSLVMVMTQGIVAHLTNDEKRAHLIDLKREHLIDQVCIQEVLPQQYRPNAAAFLQLPPQMSLGHFTPQYTELGIQSGRHRMAGRGL